MFVFWSAGSGPLAEPIFRPGMESGLKTEKPENPGHGRSLAPARNPTPVNMRASKLIH
jgi:hypothetical protein